MTLSPTALEEAADAVFGEMDNRGLFKDVGDDLFDEIKTDIATAAITAYLAQAEKDGWVMVPVEPTEAMLKAGARKARLNDSKMQDAPGYEGECHDVYAAMLAAAQNGGEPCK